MPIRNVEEVYKLPDFPKAVNRRNVAAYARVSSGSREQEHSLEAQKSFFETFIQRHEAWNYVGLYVDDGISALNTSKRNSFNKLISDALSGRIDLIVTKTISRFARNTVDSLETIRKLKAAGVEVYFQKDDIYTFDAKGEFVITLLSCFAQEESRSISENVRWGKRKAFSDGKYSVAYSSFLGYDKGEEQPLKINEEEAKLVRFIYLLFLEGRTSYYIAKLLNELSIPTPSGKKIWRAAVVKSILTNEKYKGDALLQKNFTIDYLTKKMVKNNGELPQYYVNDGHPAIIPRDIHDYVQSQLKNRHSNGNRSFSGQNTLSQKIRCKCGSFYTKKYSNHKGKYPYYRWICYHSNNKSNFHSPAISDKLLYQLIENAIIKLVSNKIQVVAKTIKTICECVPKKQPEILAYTETLDASQIGQMMMADETLRILVKTISVVERKRITVQFINGIMISPSDNK